MVLFNKSYTSFLTKFFRASFLISAIIFGLIIQAWAIEKSENVHERTSITPNASKLDVSYEDEYEAFEKELFSPTQSKSRTKRFIYLNSDTSSAVALLLGIPLTIVLPSLSNVFNKWRKRRSVPDDEMEQNSYKDDPVVQPHLDRISTYFELIDVPEHHCQLRAICEFSSDPEKFYPLSEMIISRIRNPSLPAMFYSEHEQHKPKNFQSKNAGSVNVTMDTTPTGQAGPGSLFRIYNEAANDGLTYGSGICKKNFGKQCQYSMDKLLNMPTLRFWTAMQNLLRISFRDGDSTF